MARKTEQEVNKLKDDTLIPPGQKKDTDARSTPATVPVAQGALTDVPKHSISENFEGNANLRHYNNPLKGGRTTRRSS